MFDWIKTKEAALADLEEQLRGATLAKVEADRRYEAAVAAFDADPTTGATKALSQAREAAQVAADHVGRAERLLAAGEERDRARKEHESRIRIKQLEADLEGSLKRRREELAEQEADAFGQVVEVHHQRFQHEQAIDRAKSEIRNLKRELGEPIKDDGYAAWPITVVGVHDRLIQRAARLAGEDPRRRWLHELQDIHFR